MNPSEVKYIVIHCSASRAGQDFRAVDIDGWHRRRGFKRIGYHYVVDLDGTIEEGRKLDEEGAHVKGYNHCSVGVCYVGGLDENGEAKDTRTEKQKRALEDLVEVLREVFPGAEVVGHRDLSPDKNGDGKVEPWEWLKVCPCFDVREEYGE